MKIIKELRNKEIATSHDTMEDIELAEKICYFKNGLTYSSKNSRQFSLYTFLKNKESSFISFSSENYKQYMLCRRNLLR